MPRETKSNDTCTCWYGSIGATPATGGSFLDQPAAGVIQCSINKTEKTKPNLPRARGGKPRVLTPRDSRVALPRGNPVFFGAPECRHHPTHGNAGREGGDGEEGHNNRKRDVYPGCRGLLPPGGLDDFRDRSSGGHVMADVHLGNHRQPVPHRASLGGIYRRMLPVRFVGDVFRHSCRRNQEFDSRFLRDSIDLEWLGGHDGRGKNRPLADHLPCLRHLQRLLHLEHGKGDLLSFPGGTVGQPAHRQRLHRKRL